VTLANGLRAVVVQDPHATEVQVTMRYQVGAVDDLEYPGLAHLVEHLMFQQELDGQPLFTQLEDTATYFNAATTFEATTYVARGPLSVLDKLLSIEGARLDLRCKTITDQAFEREREVVINEIRQHDRATEVIAAIHGALYPEGHPYRQSIGGSIDSVAGISREEACKFADAYYAPSDAVLVISGNLARPEVEVSLAKLARIPKRVAAAPSRIPRVVTRPQHVEVPAPVDDDILVLAWPLPVDPQLQAKVRAVAAALPRLVDTEIKGQVVALELGDRRAPMLGIAVVPADDELFEQAVGGTRHAIESLPGVFRDSGPQTIDRVVFDRIKQAAIYGLYSSLEDGSDRDATLAGYVLAGREPSMALAAELDGLRRLTPEEGAWIASRYLAANSPSVVTLKASVGRKRGDTVTLRAPVHDMGQHRTPPDAMLAHRPIEHLTERDRGEMRTRVLPNGLKLVLLPLTTVPTFDARLTFGTGTADEPERQRGVASLAAHALTWDLRFLNDAIPFVRAGGMRSADVTSDRTTFSVQGLDMNLDVVLAGLRRWVREGTYDASAETVVIAMRRAAKHVDDEGMLTDAWRAALFGPRHPYVEAGIGRYANLSLTVEDAARFRATHYTPDNATLVIAGRFDSALADRWIDYLFGDWQGHAEARRSVPVASQPSSIARADDVAMLQLRIALPASATSRARQLVAAEMLAEIAHDVRFELGASYTFDARLAETRLASFYSIGGWIDASRATAAVQLVRDRIGELRSNENAAARAFVIARSHVLAQLRSQGGSAGTLAAQVARDVELGRAPMSDRETAMAVATLTIDDMATTLADLELPRATVLMSGPAAEVRSAFDVLGRKPTYVPSVRDAQAAADAMDAPEATSPAFASVHPFIPPAAAAASLTEQPASRLLWMIAPGYATATVGPQSVGDEVAGLSLVVAASYRVVAKLAIGGYVDTARLQAISEAPRRVVGVDAINMGAVARVEGNGRLWADLLLGVHLDRVTDMVTQRRAGPVYGIRGGYDLLRVGAHRVGIAVGWEGSFQSIVKYSSLSFSLVYQR
jgi:zinc protease